METIKKHFEDGAKVYDDTIIKLIPYYRQMTDAIINAIPFEKDKNIKVLDLGCGTGNISKKVFEMFPNADICCIDIAVNMIEMAKIKLSQYKNINFHTGNFDDIEISGGFDVVVSSLAIHHLKDEEKKNFYKKVYGLMNAGGAFYNADMVLAETEYIQNINLNQWAQYMKKNIPAIEVDEKWMPDSKSGDYPSKLSEQLQWLKNAGFKCIDIIWKYYGFTVFGGLK